MKVIEFHPDELLDREHRGALSAGERAQLDEHLARCAACRFERQLRKDFAAQAHVGLESSTLPALVSGALAAAGQRNVAAEAVAVGQIRPRSTRRWAPLLAATFLLVTGVAFAQRGLMQRAWEYARNQTASPFGTQPIPTTATHPAKHVVMEEHAPVVQTPVVQMPPSEAPRPVAQTVRAPAASSELGVARSRPHRSRATAPRSAEHTDVVAASHVAVSRQAPEPASAVSEPLAVPVAQPQPAPARSAAQLFERANSLRHHGQTQEAAEIYRQLTEQFAASPEGRLALVLLARLELDRGDLVGSLRGFDSYLARGEETLREQALAGRALALGRMGQHASECSAFQALLRAYPETTYATLAQRRCGSE